MTLILRNHLARWWWVWALCLAANGLLLWRQCSARTPDTLAVFFPVWLFMGTALLSYDLRRGVTRVCLSLPLSARGLGRAWWWAVVALPAVAVLVTSAGVYLAVGWVKGTWGGWPMVISNILMCTGLLGYFFYTQTLKSVPLIGKKWGGWLNLLFTVGFSVTWFGWMRSGKYGDICSPWGVGFLVLSAFLTVKGWQQAEQLVLTHAGDGRAGQADTGVYLPLTGNPVGPGGLGFLVRRIYFWMVAPGLFIVAWMVAVLAWSEWREGKIILDTMLQFNRIILFIGSWLLLLPMVAVCAQVRFLRTLPVSSGRLAALLVLTPLAGILTLWAASCLLLTVLVAPLPMVAAAMGSDWMLQLGWMALALPVLVWRGGTKTAYVILAALFALDFWLPLHIGLTASTSTNAGLGVGLMLASVGLTILALKRGSRTYRPRAESAWNALPPITRTTA